MESIVINPHDKFFKEILSDIKNAKSFFKEYLPLDIIKTLDFNTLSIQKDSFIEKDLKEFFADILYTVSIEDKKSYIYLLLEHKSKFEKQTPFQLLQYMVKIWRLHIKQKGFPLPIIIPLVLYHGQDKWKLKTDFMQLFDNSNRNFKNYIPNFNYVLRDLSQYTDEQIKGEILLKAALLLFKYVSRKNISEKLPEIFSLLRSITNSKTGLDSLEVFFRYIYYSSDLPVEQLKKIANKSLNKRGEEVIMTTAEKLINEGVQQGVRKGVQQGMQQGMQQSIINILKTRFNSVDEKIIQSLNKITDFEKLNDITKQAISVRSPNELNFINITI